MSASASKQLQLQVKTIFNEPGYHGLKAAFISDSISYVLAIALALALTLASPCGLVMFSATEGTLARQHI